ncbi:response regulator [Mucilaginibacter sp. S1162]|uniref:Response regulator n=1 Tax=Mucilaginibacter humi TaxID=2732510 RepID=A0ABX1VZ40_9SPHI|nr:response regulator [Mucilaginibacter humi]NNU33145.1 response regulator [Mucilaginibacter humi]
MTSLAATQSAGKTLVIFDDEEDILTICSYILTEQGWTVHTFTDCEHILDKLANINPEVIFMDNWIPKEGGIIATQTLKKSADYCQVPVVYFSANADIASLAKSAGADAYLAKPFELDELAAVIERVTKVAKLK